MTPRRDHYSAKFVDIQCPDGHALLTYTGVAELPCPRRFIDRARESNMEPGVQAGEAISVADWVAWTLHGETRTVDQSLLAIRDAANDEVVLRSHPHMFTVGAFLGDDAWVAQIRNMAADQWPLGTLRRRFETVAQQVEEPLPPLVAGDPRALTRADYQQLEPLVRGRPRRPEKLLDRLAEANRRAAGRVDTVSSECSAQYLAAPAFRKPNTAGASGKHYGNLPPEIDMIRIVLFGINLVPMTRSVVRDFHDMRSQSEEEA